MKVRWEFYKGQKDPRMMVSGSITMYGLSYGRVNPCGVCSLRIKANSDLCAQCGIGIHGKCVRMEMVTPKFSTRFS